jgi:hypothetical protein
MTATAPRLPQIDAEYAIFARNGDVQDVRATAIVGGVAMSSRRGSSGLAEPLPCENETDTRADCLTPFLL